MRAGLPPGPPYPALIQGIGFWTRPLGFLRQCRERYGKRFTIRFPLAPRFVMLADPSDVKEVFTAPPDVLHPGEGARVLQPVVGSNSVILLDEGAHMEQRKMMLPAFHGEKMARLSGLISEVAEREVASWPLGERIELHPRMQSLTLEIILRAVFGLDPGPRLEAIRERLQAMLEMGIVLRAVLASREVQPAGNGFERARRRNITIRPAQGARAVLRDRAAAKRAPTDSQAAAPAAA